MGVEPTQDESIAPQTVLKTVRAIFGLPAYYTRTAGL